MVAIYDCYQKKSFISKSLLYNEKHNHEQTPEIISAPTHFKDDEIKNNKRYYSNTLYTLIPHKHVTQERGWRRELMGEIIKVCYMHIKICQMKLTDLYNQ